MLGAVDSLPDPVQQPGLSRADLLWRGGAIGAASVAARLALGPENAVAAGTDSPYVNPDALRAAGDPDDTNAINGALATGSRVMLTRGKTYVVSSPLNMTRAGQVLDGNGARLKRANQSGSTEWNTIYISASDCRVRDLEIDGNKTNYPTANWATTAEIRVEAGGDRAVIERCHIHDFPGEGIQQGNSDDVAVIGNVLVDGNGNGIHYGSGGRVYKGGQVLYNTVKNVNGNPAVGHADGCVVLSDGVGDFVVHGNYLENGISGVGSIDSTDNLDLTITCNTIRAMTGTAIEGDNPPGAASTNVLVEGNRIYDSGSIAITQQRLSSSVFPARWTVRGNLLWNTTIHGNYALWQIIEGNVFAGGGASATYIDMAGPKYLTIADNQFDGGQTGVNVGDAFDTVAIKRNVFVGQSSRAVNVYSGGGVRMSIAANVIRDAGDRGISLGADRAAVRGNDVLMSSGGAGILVGSNYNAVTANTVRVGKASNSIQIASGATANVVHENQSDKAITDGGTRTDKTGNVRLAA
ncbi:MAG: Right handed beta helix region [Solirubrobacteraceae bacterium]|nr:Right handed beta helix region [Solirubrobacteraceae bacterium]